MKTPSAGNKTNPTWRIYRLSAAKQTAFEIMRYWFGSLGKHLVEETGNVMTEQTAVSGHAPLLLDGRVIASSDTGDPGNPLQRTRQTTTSRKQCSR